MRKEAEPCSPHERRHAGPTPGVASGRAFARPVAHPGYGRCLFSYAIALRVNGTLST